MMKVKLEIGQELIPLVHLPSQPNIVEEIGRVRQQLASEQDIRLPLVNVFDSLLLPPRGYRIIFHGAKEYPYIVVDEGQLPSDNTASRLAERLAQVLSETPLPDDGFSSLIC